MVIPKVYIFYTYYRVDRQILTSSWPYYCSLSCLWSRGDVDHCNDPMCNVRAIIMIKYNGRSYKTPAHMIIAMVIISVELKACGCDSEGLEVSTEVSFFALTNITATRISYLYWRRVHDPYCLWYEKARRDSPFVVMPMVVLHWYAYPLSLVASKSLWVYVCIQRPKFSSFFAFYFPYPLREIKSS